MLARTFFVSSESSASDTSRVEHDMTDLTVPASFNGYAIIPEVSASSGYGKSTPDLAVSSPFVFSQGLLLVQSHTSTVVATPKPLIPEVNRASIRIPQKPRYAHTVLS